jgi:cytoskeletal protein CcmA (bactofilin family)
VENQTVLGRTIEIDGEIEGDEDLVVQGIVRGNIRSKKDVTIDGTGDVEATVSARNLSISGRLKGNVDVLARVELCREGTMTGDIRAPRIVLADGSKFKGGIETVPADE